jgi:AcrR family transcriptional regulator
MAAGSAKSPAAPAAKRRGRPADHDSQVTRATIVTTAQRLFGHAGFKGVTMDQLARECGLTVRALYHYFPSKRDLLQAATDEALGRFGDEIMQRVFVHENLRDRLRGFTDVYRSLHESDQHVLAFIGMALVDAISSDIPAGGAALSDSAKALERASLGVQALNEALIADAVARGELADGVSAAGAKSLLEMLGVGLGLAALGDTSGFLTMLDTLERLTEGTLFRDPPG